MINISPLTYTNNDFSYFFTFKHNNELLDLNLLLMKVIKSQITTQDFTNIIITLNLSQKQIDYINSFLQTAT